MPHQFHNLPRGVLLVEDSLPIRERVRAMIESARAAVVMGEAASVPQAREAFYRLRPDAVVLDIRLGNESGHALIGEFKRECEDCVLIVLSNFLAPDQRERCLALGADHCFDKAHEFESVVEVLGALAAGQGTPPPGQAPWAAVDPLALLQAVEVAVYACDAQGRLSYFNPAALALWGQAPEAGPEQWCGSQRLFDAAGRPLALHDYPTAAVIGAGREGALARRRTDLTLRRPDGALRHVISSAAALYHTDGSPAGAVDTMIDVTAQRHAEAARHQREAVLERALDASRLALWDLDIGSGRVHLSAGWSQMLGGANVPTSTTLAGLLALVPVEDHGRITTAMLPALRGSNSDYSVEHRVCRPDGATIWILSEGKVTERSASGRALRGIGTNRDITERKLAEAAMRESEQRLRELVELAVDWYWEQDEQFRFVRISRLEDDDHAGVSGAEHIGKARWELPHVGIGEGQWQQHREQLERQEPFTDFELRRHGADGALRTLLVSGVPRFDASGRFAGYRGVTRDVSAQRAAEAQRRAMEEQLREAQKLESIGLLASSVAHDFNGIVGAILANVVLAREAIDAGRDGLAALEQIQQVALRARAIAQQILAYARRQPHRLTATPLRPLVEQTVAMLRSTLPRQAVLETALRAEAELLVHADATQIQQLLLNLCTNAAQALTEHGGRVVVGLEAVRLHEGRATAAGRLTPGRHARLWVQDEGHGIDEATRARIFEPFFTTKDEGTGLGLAIVRNIVAAHGGAIDVSSAPGQGSLFEVFLPLPDGEEGVAPPLASAAGAAGTLAGRHLLLVDDDEVVRLTTSMFLQRGGARVTAHASAREALAAVLRGPREFDLVLLDHSMGEMTGIELARCIAAIDPGLPMVMSTGEGSADLRAQARAAGISEVVNKLDMAEGLRAAALRALASARQVRRAGAA